MTKLLAYCAFLGRNSVSLPASGVEGAAVQVLADRDLRVAWSQVDFPFRQEHLQKSAVEFHNVISHIFQQVAVVPFRLLSVFAGRNELQEFIGSQHQGFVADLERLHNLVQMECVVYWRLSGPQAASTSGTAYLQEKAQLVRDVQNYVENVRSALGPIAMDFHAREVKTGRRTFALVPKGSEATFRSAINQLSVPAPLFVRLSGPWPPAEFLSPQVKAPEIAGKP